KSSARKVLRTSSCRAVRPAGGLRTCPTRTATAENGVEGATDARQPLIARPVAKFARAATESSTAHPTVLDAGNKIPVATKPALAAAISAQSSGEKTTAQFARNATPHRL